MRRLLRCAVGILCLGSLAGCADDKKTEASAISSPLTDQPSSTRIFRDDFDISGAPDPTQWSTVSGAGPGISVQNGLLILEGSPDHKEINTVPAFSPDETSIAATAAISLSGDYQKFGFNVNYGGIAPGTGFYFDTLESAFGGSPGLIHALAWVNGAQLSDTAISISWTEPHVFGVQWSSTAVAFSIDGITRSASPLPALSNSLNVGVWNDRASSMNVDWVQVSGDSCPEPGSSFPVTLASKVDALLGFRNQTGIPKPYGVWLQDVVAVFSSVENDDSKSTCRFLSSGTDRKILFGPALPGVGGVAIPGNGTKMVPSVSVGPTVTLDFFQEGVIDAPPICDFDIFGSHDGREPLGCLLGEASADPRLVRWHTPGFPLKVNGRLFHTLQPRTFWVDLKTLPTYSAGSSWRDLIQSVESRVEERLAANIVFAQTRLAIFAEPPADVRVADWTGKATGPLANGTEIDQIPGSAHTTSADGGAVLIVEPPDGMYYATIVGAPGTPYALVIATIDYSNDSSPPATEERDFRGRVSPTGPLIRFRTSRRESRCSR